jgi:hypothetical protein
VVGATDVPETLLLGGSAPSSNQWAKGRERSFVFDAQMLAQKRDAPSSMQN